MCFAKRFAVVELKYVPKKTFIVPINWIKNYSPGQGSTFDFVCYISIDLKDDPDFRAKYYTKFNGNPGLFKVFVLTTTDSLEDAINYQERKRVKSIPSKFRRPANTEGELNAEEAKRKKKMNIVKKVAIQSAKVKNMAHFASMFETQSENDQPMAKTIETEDEDHNRNVTEGTMIFPIELENYNKNDQPIIVTIATENNETMYVPINPLNEQQMIKSAIQNNDQQMNINVEPMVSAIEHDHLNIDEQQMMVISIEPEVQNNNDQNIVVPMNASTAYSDIVQEALGNMDFSSTCFEEDMIFMDNCPLFDSDNANIYDTVDHMMPTSETYTDGALDSVGTITQPTMHQYPIVTSINEPMTPTTIVNDPGLKPSTSAPTKYCDKENTISNQRSGNGDKIDYKKAYLQLKDELSILGDRNVALQNALVAADKAMGKVPQVPYTEQNGGRLYKDGVFLGEIQCKVLDATTDNKKYVNNLAIAVFGRQTLMNSSVTGTASKNYGHPAKPPLNPLWLQLIYDLTDAKTNKTLSKADINKILNKKISNLNGSDKRKSEKLAHAATVNVCAGKNQATQDQI